MSSIVTRRAAQRAKVQTRAMVNNKSVTNRRPTNPTLAEIKRKAKSRMPEQVESEMKDDFKNAVNAKNMTNGPTGIVYDMEMAKHRCLWDDKHPECPERYTHIIARCEGLDLFERCNRIPARKATQKEIMLLHTEEHYNALQRTSGVDNEEEMEDLSSRYDSVFIHPTTFDLSLRAVGSTIDLVEQIVKGKVKNGMAFVRPPGHHAMTAEFNGYCFFNNVALAAKHALEHLNVNRILIIDWDVHHGQGTQRFFYNDPRVLYFSIHRFEHGTFWPNLKESDFDAIGEGEGCGFNFNIPLNKIGMGNGDYLAIFQQVLIPVAMEYQPELIIISAGFDAALGCPEGEMEVTPAFYPHLINPLLQLANSRVAVVLEGGYCVESLAESAALTLRALLGDPCPLLVEKLVPPCAEIKETILNCIFEHRPYWKCLQVQRVYTEEDLNNVHPQSDLHKVRHNFVGGPPPPERFQTRGTGPKTDPLVVDRKLARLAYLKAETKLFAPSIRACYVYDPFLLEHFNTLDEHHPEKPERIKKIHEVLTEYKLLDDKRMKRLDTQRSATTDEICLAHLRTHVNTMRRITEKDDVSDIGAKYDSVYLHPKTYDCATRAAGSVLEVVDEVLSGKVRSGICNVRPPGHHAETDKPHGFCIFNNVAIAALYAIRDHNLKKVLIVDWDVHHGNGTQHIFEENKKVLYISVHRYDNGNFFPKSTDGDYTKVGKGDGLGFNVNIPWNKKGMGDMEYAMAFQQIIMPIAYEYDPELVLISAGFDAAVGDPLGGCKVTPEAYGLFTHWLSGLANGRVIAVLEGGYNINSISYSMAMCAKSLLGDPIPPISGTSAIANQNARSTPSAAYLSCIETIQNCTQELSRYWSSLVFNTRLPGGSNTEDFISASLKNLDITKDDDPPIRNGINVATENGSMEPSGSKPKVKVKTTLTDFFVEYAEALENGEMYAIIPKKTCPHLTQLRPAEAPTTINTNAPCSECNSTAENWICLTCFKVLCSYYIEQHMSLHNEATQHPMALSFSDLSVWCYPCASYVDNCNLYLYKNLAHRHKFNAELIWSYGNDEGGEGNGNTSSDNDYDEEVSCLLGDTDSEQHN